MCGFFYTNNKNLKPDLSDLIARGPDETHTLTNDYGFFHHSRLITRTNSITQPAVNMDGILLYNGTEYSLQNNDTLHILNNFSKNINKNLDFLKTLNGDYSICFVTDEYIFLARDYFATKPLFFSIQNNEIAVASTEYALKSIGHNPLRLPENSLYIIGRKNFNLVKKTKIINFNLEQNVNSYDNVFESFEKSVLNKYTDDSFLSLSSGYDTGCIAACLTKYKKNYNIISYTKNENIQILFDRAKLTNGEKLIINEKKFNDGKQDIKLLPFYDYLQSEEEICGIIYASAKCASRKNYRVNLTGNGGDDIFSDYSNNGKRLTNRTAFNGIFPADLSLIWPYIMKSNGSTYEHVPLSDYINGIFGIDSRHPLLDRQLVQNFLNLKVELKNNVYKNWLDLYMKYLKYPFVKEKTAIGGSKIISLN